MPGNPVRQTGSALQPESGPRWRIALPAVALALMTAAFTITKTGRDALYMQAGGVRGLPVAYIGTALIAPFVSMLALAGMARFGPRMVRVAGPLAMAVFQFWVAGRARPGSGPYMTLLFMMIPAVYGVLLSSTWLLAAESALGSPEDRSRAYAILASSAVAGSIFGAVATRILAAHIDPAWLYAAGASVLAACVLAIMMAHHALPPAALQNSHPGRIMPPLRSLATLFSEGYVRVLGAVIVSSSLVGVLIEFLFYASVSTSLVGVRATSAYFATFYIWLNVAGLLLQLALLPLIHRRVGLGGSLLLVPAAVASGAILLIPQLLTPGALRITDGGLRSSIYRASWEQAYGLLSSESRVVVKVLAEGIGSRLGEALAALLILGALSYSEFAHAGSDLPLIVIRVLLVATTLTWALSVRRMKRIIGMQEHCVLEESLHPGMHPQDGCALTATLGQRLLHLEKAHTASGV